MDKPGKSDETRVNGRQRGLGAFPEKIGKYRIDSMLGKGGMGVVYLGRDPGLDRQVVLSSRAISKSGNRYFPVEK